MQQVSNWLLNHLWRLIVDILENFLVYSNEAEVGSRILKHCNHMKVYGEVSPELEKQMSHV